MIFQKENFAFAQINCVTDLESTLHTHTFTRELRPWIFFPWAENYYSDVVCCIHQMLKPENVYGKKYKSKHLKAICEQYFFIQDEMHLYITCIKIKQSPPFAANNYCYCFLIS